LDLNVIKNCAAETIGTPRRNGRFILNRMNRSQHIVAIGLLTQQDLNLLGRGFDRAFPVDPTPCFDDLLQAIDEADRKLDRTDASDI